MQSAFNTRNRSTRGSSRPFVDESYNLRGLNLSFPDEIMPQGQTPYLTNSRMYARNDGETRVTQRTRKGASRLCESVGFTANVSNTATATGDVPFSVTDIVAQPFTPSASGALVRLEPEIKRDATSRGHVIVEIYSNNAGLPGMLIAQGSILASDISSSYQYLPAFFIEAPQLNSGTQYWIVYYIQDNGGGNYYLHKTASAGDLLSTNDGISWTSLGYSSRYKSYTATVGGIKGFHLRYPSSPDNRIMFAQIGSIYSSTKTTGNTPVQIDSGLNASAPKVRFEQIDDKTIWVNGFNHARWWDGTTVTDIGNVPTPDPSNVISWQNRLFFMTGPTRVDFSELSDFETYPSVNFFYVPTPKSPDHMTGWKVFQDNLVIFTHETKHVIIGSDISNFTRKEAVGTKGAVSQEAIAADRNYIYFMADDGQVYRWNGVSDELLSQPMEPEFQSIQNLADVRLHVYRNQLRVYYGKAPSAVNDRMALYDLEQKEWFMDTDHFVEGSTELYLDNNELVEFSSLVGRTYYGETQYSDLGRKLDWEYRTPYKTYGYHSRTGQSFGGGSTKKRVRRFRPILRTVDADYTMEVGKDMDFADKPDMRAYIVSGGGAKWGDFVWGDGTKWGKAQRVANPAPMSGRGNHIQFRFKRSGVETPVELYGYIAQIKIGKPK